MYIYSPGPPSSRFAVDRGMQLGSVIHRTAGTVKGERLGSRWVYRLLLRTALRLAGWGGRGLHQQLACHRGGSPVFARTLTWHAKVGKNTDHMRV